MASQLAQFSQLSQLETMNSSFSEALEAAERTYANSLIGKEVSFSSETDEGTSDIVSGTVEQVVNDYEGEVVLLSGNYVISLEDVISVRNEQ
jgi:flagellar hook assembly protein FlgD